MYVGTQLCKALYVTLILYFNGSQRSGEKTRVICDW